MRVPIHSTDDLGLAVRAARKAASIRLDDLAATVGVSKQFASDLEHGKPGVRLGLVLQVLRELGVEVHVDLPDDSGPALEALRATGLRPLKPRAAGPGSPGR